MYVGNKYIKEGYINLDSLTIHECQKSTKKMSEADKARIKTVEASMQLSTQQPALEEGEELLAYKIRRTKEIETRLAILKIELAEAKRKLKEHNERHELFKACCPIL